MILVEEPLESGIAWPLFDWAAVSRIVTFSLHHTRATVYDPLYADAGDPVDLVKAIQGVRMLDVPPGARPRAGEGITSAPDRPATDTASHPDASRMRKEGRTRRATRA